MNRYSKKSQAELDTCHTDLQVLFTTVLRDYDHSILNGRRTLEEQKENVKKDVSKTLNSKHIPPEGSDKSEAVDVTPYIPGRGKIMPQVKSKSFIKDLNQMYHFAGFVLKTALQLGIKVRWGGDWDKDYNIADQTFDDLFHWELV